MWSNFEASQVEDETISNAFSSRGIFKISNEDEVIKYPSVEATVQNGKMVISIDKSLLLLEDELVAKCSFLSFSAPIDAIATSKSGNLIVLGLSDGEIHGVFIKGLLLFSVCVDLKDVDTAGAKTFTAIKQLERHFYCTCSNGSIYRLSEIDEHTLEAQLSSTINDNESLAGDKAILEDVTIKRISSCNSLNNADSTVLLTQLKTHIYAENNPDSIFLLIAGTQGSVNFCTTTRDLTRIQIPTKFGNIKQIYNLDHYIIALTTMGQLLEICPYTRIINFCPVTFDDNMLIEDLQVLECNEDHIEFLVLTKLIKDARYIKMIEYPSLKCKNEVEVTEHAWLVRQPKYAVNLYYLGAKEVNSKGWPSEVEMMLVSETDPSDRFKKLIAKGRLEEAEEFGKQFELCLQPIFEAKAKRVLIELSTMRASTAGGTTVEDKFQTLLQLLGKIENNEFLRNNRMIMLPSRCILERFLHEVLKRLDCDDDEKHIEEINEQLHRLKTLAITDPYECNADWQKFVYQSNLVKVVKSLLASDMATACLIWRRHASSILNRVDDDTLQKLLGCIPSTTEPFNIVLWVSQFAPTVSNTHPTIMPILTDWVIEKTRELQYFELWPDIGLEFAQKNFDIFNSIVFIYSDVRRQHERNMGKLRSLVNALQELSVLKTSYKLSFTLDNYLEGSMDVTALSVLQRVQLDKLQSLVDDFLYPIFQEKGRTPVDAIKRYILQLVANRMGQSNWLQRAIACIDLLHNEDSRMECALAVLQNAPVPWPDALAPLIKLRVSTHPLAVKIHAEYEIQVIKIMKAKYGWPSHDGADIDLELFMMRIVKMDLPGMLDDIRSLTKAARDISVSANFNCCYQMTRRGQTEEAYEFFKSLSPTSCRQSVVDIFANLLESSPLATLEKGWENLLELYKLMLPHVDPIYGERYLTTKNRFVLHNKFHLQIANCSELMPLQQRLQFLNDALDGIIERCQTSTNMCMFIASETSELCVALGLQKVLGLQRICQRLGCLPLTCAVANHVLQFLDCNPDNADDFINLAIELLAQQIIQAKGAPNEMPTTTSSLQLMQEKDPLSLPLTHDLLVTALQHNRNRVHDLVELIKLVRVAVLGYPLNVIREYYDNQKEEINEQICRALEGVTVATANSTLNFSTLNASLDVKPIVVGQSTKKRYSVSIFDDVNVQVKEQPQHRPRHTTHLATIKFIARTILLMVIETELKNSLLVQLNDALPATIKADVDGARADFFLSLEQLTKTKEHQVWYVMSQYLLNYQAENKGKKIINAGFVTLQLRRLFRNAINDKDVSFLELLSMLVADNEAVALLEKLGSEVKTDQQKVNYLTLSEMYNAFTGDTENVEIIRAKRIKLFYYLEFCQQDSGIRGKFNTDMDNIEHLLKEFHNKLLNVQLLDRMSRDFGLDFQKILISQILSILRAQELKYEIKLDTFGDEELNMLSSVHDMRELCQPYINEIKNIELFTAKLMEFIDDINIYFYELYLCVIELLTFFDAAPKEMKIWTNILHFLRHKMTTRRRNRPGQLETDLWLQSQKDNGVLPKIARYRLPFKAIVERPLKDFLDSELNVDNCQSWFPLIQMHTTLRGSSEILQNCDYFCMTAVKNSIAEYKAKNDSETWRVQPTNNAFLQSILRLVKNVNSPSKAFFILYFVASYAPDGADQVDAAYECWKFVKENDSLITDSKCHEQLAKIKRRYPILKTQHLLHIYGMTDEKLLRLVENPSELVHCLYHHELILTSGKCKVDINTLVKEICELHELNLEAIQFKLLQKWLSVTMEHSDGTILEETFLEDHNWPEDAANGSSGNGGGGSGGVGAGNNGSATENVIRANYILSSWPKTEAVQFLVGLIFKGGSVNTTNQLQMYECYSKLNDGSNSFGNTINQRQYIAIKCVHQLNALGYKLNIDKFADDHCNKIDILKRLWQRNAQNPLSLEVMANICLGFDIHLPKIWNGILKRMVLFRMEHELNALVDVLSCKPQLLSIEGLAQAWDYVLCHPLKNATQTRSDEQEEQLYKTMVRLHTCPIVHALDLFQFAELCTLIHRPHMAATVLLFCQNTELRNKIKKLIKSRPREDLRKEILELEEVGALPMVLNFALKELNL